MTLLLIHFPLDSFHEWRISLQHGMPFFPIIYHLKFTSMSHHFEALFRVILDMTLLL